MLFTTDTPTAHIMTGKSCTRGHQSSPPKNTQAGTQTLQKTDSREEHSRGVGSFPLSWVYDLLFSLPTRPLSFCFHLYLERGWWAGITLPQPRKAPDNNTGGNLFWHVPAFSFTISGIFVLKMFSGFLLCVSPLCWYFGSHLWSLCLCITTTSDSWYSQMADYNETWARVSCFVVSASTKIKQIILLTYWTLNLMES